MADPQRTQLRGLGSACTCTTGTGDHLMSRNALFKTSLWRPPMGMRAGGRRPPGQRCGEASARFEAIVPDKFRVNYCARMHWDRKDFWRKLPASVVFHRSCGAVSAPRRRASPQRSELQALHHRVVDAVPVAHTAETVDGTTLYPAWTPSIPQGERSRGSLLPAVMTSCELQERCDGMMGHHEPRQFKGCPSSRHSFIEAVHVGAQNGQ